jgi:dienelactone hydrolase
MKTLAIAALLLAFPNPTRAAANVLPADPNPGELIERHLKAKFSALTAARDAAFEKLNGQPALAKWQAERRAFFLQQIGELPNRAPLKARITGRLKGDGYRIEKVIFESRPNHHVTAVLYLPATKGPFPAVLIPCGHSHNGKASGQYQRAAILFAQNGMTAFCYDPVGQGERYQIIDREQDTPYFMDIPRNLAVPHPAVRHLCTTEHTLMGIGSMLLGENIAQYRIWDGMRAIDYLQSRPDIIGDKIGCTGNSGGGTLTSYLMALERRIVAASPGSYLTTFQRLIETKGPQDGEQNIFGQIAFGMNAADYVMMRAPVPILICASTRDSTFDIAGARKVFQQANRFYSHLGFPDRVAINEADVPHGYYIQHREAVARWMHRWLRGKDREIWEKPRNEWPEVVTDTFLRSLSEPVWTQEELYCSPQGQIMLMAGERSVFDINTDKATALNRKRGAEWSRSSPEQKRETVRKAVGLGSIGPSRIETVGSDRRDAYTVNKLILHRESGIPLPALAFVPNGKIKGRVLYLHGESLAASKVPATLAREGKLVLSAELSGIGETDAGRGKRTWGYGRFGLDNQEIFTAYLMGDSFVRMRIEDTLMWAGYFSGRKIELIGQGEAGIPALHAAALQPELFSAVELRNMIRSWSEVVQQPEHYNQLVNAVHGVLRHYDLPDLIKLTGARVREPVGVDWRPE